MRPVDDLQFAFHGFDQGREALHPVAVVAVKLAVDLADFGLVDMPAAQPRRRASSVITRSNELMKFTAFLT